MKRIATIVIIAMALAAGAPSASAATPPGHAALRSAEWNSIQLVIDDQLKALRAGDGAKAMSYAAPGLRQRFGTPERFMRMVREGFRPLLDARSSAFLDGAVVDGITIQPLQLVLPDSSVVVALYRMEKQRDGVWRIAGCVIAPSKAQST